MGGYFEAPIFIQGKHHRKQIPSPTNAPLALKHIHLPQPIMNFDSLSSTYKGYKADTQIFTTWLTQTAIDKGYSPHLLKSNLQKPKENERSNTFGITVAQLLNHAQYLSSQNPPTAIPRDIAAAGKRALTERCKCHD